MKRFIAALSIALASSFATAGPITIGFDDGAGTQDGTMTWAGGLAPLVGSGIDFYTIDGTGTPLNSGPGFALDCLSCVLEFETGAYTGAGGVFEDGGYFTVTGTAYDPIAAANVAVGTLLDGYFDDFLADPTFTGLGGSTGIFIGLGLDTKHDGLLDYFGMDLATNFVYANTEIALASCGSGSCIVTNADIDNLARVPEPGTLVLMALGLCGVVAARKRA